MGAIAFINNHFPALSATFIYREVLDLKERGVNLRTYSIRRPDPNSLSDDSLDLLRTTTYLLPASLYNLGLAHVRFIFKNPARYLHLIFFLMTREFDKPVRDRVRTFFHFCEGVLFAALIKDSDEINHIHAHYASHPATLAMVASKLTGIPFSFTAHAHDIWEDRLFVGDKLRAALFVVTCTKHAKDRMSQEHGEELCAKITHIYHGINIDEFSRNPSETDSSEYVILNVGRLCWEKAQKNLILACKRVKDRGYKFRCIIAGDGPLKDALMTLIEQNELNNTVELIGRVFQQDIKKLYEQANLFVLSSIQENLPNVLVESLSMGVPSVATSIAAIPELIEHKETGILVPPNDVEELANAIIFMMDNKAVSKRLGDNGRARVCERFDCKESISQLLNLYSNYGLTNKCDALPNCGIAKYHYKTNA